MSESESRNVGRDALGIVLFGGAAFACISVWMAFGHPVEASTGGVIARSVTAFVGLVGFVPAAALTLGLTLLGARLWLFSRGEHLARHVLGLVGLTAGMSVLAGAVAVDGGGLLGAWSGEKVTSFMSPLVSVPFGLACLLLPVWLAWARPREAISWNVGQEPAPPAAVTTAPEAEGVSAAEAAALLPRVPPAPPAHEPPPSPYPPDVRPMGGIPEGAQPIYSDDELRPAAAFQDSSHEAALLGRSLEEPEAPPEPPGPDLAGSPAGPFAGGSSHYLEFPLPEPQAAPDAPDAPAAEGTTRPLEAPGAPNPPRPSWEQSSLFEEEPVDAYGTPLSVLSSHRGEDQGAVVVDPPDVPFELREVSLAERAAARAEAVDEALEDEEVELEDDAVLAAVAEEELLADEDEELDEEEDGEVLAEVDEDEDEESEEEDEEEDEVLAEAEADEEEGEEGEEDEEDEEETAAAPVEPERQVVLEPRPAPAAGAAVDDDLVRRAARLFLERKRVAVSMLQREFDLDFSQSTLVLDQLQEQGLIGPYLGGQRRDILMTADEWERRTATT